MAIWGKKTNLPIYWIFFTTGILLHFVKKQVGEQPGFFTAMTGYAFPGWIISKGFFT
jgi:hypothetical protein